MALIIDGKKISADIKDELKKEVEELQKKGIQITLAVVQVGNDSASSVYVGNKK
ncbi:MAG TPA: bifunctional methylenetetrahydrofolate dehydrogenase/methenyltetrahydrofolate cyclohydrolase, partial [Lachnospiraceae bacterium]|nr:bifunctional methylenetetrahydrofolate dehydrogenase/methenyltetrahydrofolate cyclohydrolase [Lachnospiraceae bacterium]